MEKITLQTTDKIELIGNHFQIKLPSAGISLFHMMPAAKESFTVFAEKMQLAGIGVLAIDLRGHGESQGGSDGYNKFSNQEHRTSIKDVKAAVDFQTKERHAPLFVGGASIGANLSLQIIAEDKRIKKAILLSPGLNYRGIETLPLAGKVSEDKDIYIVTAKDDARSSGSNAEQARAIFEELKCRKKIKVFETGGHGTDILDAHPEFIEELVEWLKG